MFTVHFILLWRELRWDFSRFYFQEWLRPLKVRVTFEKSLIIKPRTCVIEVNRVYFDLIFTFKYVLASLIKLFILFCGLFVFLLTKS